MLGYSNMKFEFDLNYSDFPNTLKNDYILIELIDNEKNIKKTKRLNYKFGKISFLDSLELFWNEKTIRQIDINYPEVSNKQLLITFGILIVGILTFLFGPGILKRL